MFVHSSWNGSPDAGGCVKLRDFGLLADQNVHADVVPFLLQFASAEIEELSELLQQNSVSGGADGS